MQQSFIIAILLLMLGLFFYHSNSSTPTPGATSVAEVSLPSFRVIDLMQPDKTFTQHDIVGHVALLNFWTSGCHACQIEQPILMKISQEYKIPIYSLNYGDGSQAAKRWLQKWGNPYVTTGLDTTGFVALQMGVYGTPETFLIDDQGVVRYRQVGALDLETWNTILLPLVRQYEIQ